MRRLPGYVFDPVELRPGQADIIASLGHLLNAVGETMPASYAALLGDYGSGLLALAIRAGHQTVEAEQLALSGEVDDD